jgi:H+/Cl- antiporter ClcA
MWKLKSRSKDLKKATGHYEFRRLIPDVTDSKRVKEVLREESILAISVIKWVLLSTLIGLIVGLSTAVFLKSLTATTELTARYPYYFLLLPIGMVASALLIKWLAPDAEGHGTEKVIEAVHKRSGRIKLMVVPVKLVATLLTVGFGGSVGKEGPCAQIGAGLSSAVASLFRFNDHDRKKLVICGISAGFAAVFGTPIAGSIFGVEVLFAGSILYEVLLPSFISGVTAFQISHALGVTYFAHAINVVPVFTESFFIKVVFAGMVFGFCSMITIETVRRMAQFGSMMKVPLGVKAFVGGLVLIGLTLVVSTRYLGLGLDTIVSVLGGSPIPWYAFFLKGIFTGITLGFGGSGGIVTPIFFIGSAAGSAFANIFGLDPPTFAGIGLVCLLAGSANTPIAASIMSVEMFGPKIATYATVACVISFLMTGHRSVYPSQVVAIRKSPSVDVEVGWEMQDVKVVPKIREDSLTGRALRFLHTLARLIKRDSW